MQGTKAQSDKAMKARRLSRSGFSFTEVLFAVIILGVGFIMIAAIFPVAIQQTKSSTEETSGSTIARGAVNYIQAVAVDAIVPATTTVMGDAGDFVAIAPDDAKGKDLWLEIKGSVILPQDPRYGWVALYRRGLDSGGVALPYAQVVIIPCEVRNATTFVTNDTYFTSATTAVNLQPRLLTGVDFTDGAAGIDTIDVGTSVLAAGAVSGTNVIIASGSERGRIFRIGNAVSGSVYELVPGNDMEEDDGTTITNVDAYILGRGWTSPTNSDLTGNAMDIGVYTTFVKVN